MPLKVSSRGSIPPFIVMDVMQAAAEREAAAKAVYHMEVGQPGTPAPQGVLEAAKRAIDDNRLGYTVALGIPELRAAIAGHYVCSYGVHIDPSRIVVTRRSPSPAAFCPCFSAHCSMSGKFGDPRPVAASQPRPAGKPSAQQTRVSPTWPAAQALSPTTTSLKAEGSSTALRVQEASRQSIAVSRPGGRFATSVCGASGHG